MWNWLTLSFICVSSHTYTHTHTRLNDHGWLHTFCCSSWLRFPFLITFFFLSLKTLDFCKRDSISEEKSIFTHFHDKTNTFYLRKKWLTTKFCVFLINFFFFHFFYWLKKEKNFFIPFSSFFIEWKC